MTIPDAYPMTQHPIDAPQFFLTTLAPCPYLPERLERKVFTHLFGSQASTLNDALTHGGFRRSQNIAYRPACEGCRECTSVRVLVDEMRETRNFSRVWRRNQDLVATLRPPKASNEQFRLFRRYLSARHRAGGMTQMTMLDFAMMVEDSHVETQVIEYRSRDPDTSTTGVGTGPLVAMCLADTMSDGLSLVYSFFDPLAKKRSLGTYMILDHVRRARRLGLPYLYLGYWIKGSATMAYKARFYPQERLGAGGWQRYDGPAGQIR